MRIKERKQKIQKERKYKKIEIRKEVRKKEKKRMK